MCGANTDKERGAAAAHTKTKKGRVVLKESYKPLLTPWKIGKVEIKNRIVLTSMGGTDLFGWMEVNHFDKDGARFILEVAKNNAGLVLPGCQPVYNPMYGQWLHKNKKMYEDLAKWMPEFHKTGAKLFVQLTAGFGRSFTISEMMEKLYTNKALRAVSKPFMDLDKITATASPSPNRWSDKVPSREMTKAEIQEFIDSFAKCAKLLQDAGVDGVEVHAVHEGYLLDQFTLHYVNKRTDEYGGSLENRYRFAAEIVKAIKAACGPDFPVSLRYSVVSKTKGFRQGALPGEDYVEAGRDMAESEIAAKFLQDAGYDMLNCDNGTYDAWYWAHPPVYMPENCNLAEVEHNALARRARGVARLRRGRIAELPEAHHRVQRREAQHHSPVAPGHVQPGVRRVQQLLAHARFRGKAAVIAGSAASSASVRPHSSAVMSVSSCTFAASTGALTPMLFLTATVSASSFE